MQEPAGPGIRHDCGIYSGFEVSVYYDPILSKVITWAETREDARRRMLLALSNYTILGIKTTIGFLSSVMAHPEFVAGNTHTNFIDKNMSNLLNRKNERKFLNEALLAAAVASQMKISDKRPIVKEKAPSPWQTLGKWSIGGS
jgi:acetyl/propionyl-CoA carboxylase alpha subunit